MATLNQCNFIGRLAKAWTLPCREFDPNDPIVKEYRKLSATLRNLKRQRDEAARIANEDPTRSITGFYHVLSHLRAEFNKQDPQTKKDIMKKLIDEEKINALSQCCIST